MKTIPCYIVFDTETTGLPIRVRSKKDDYSPCHILSISIRVFQYNDEVLEMTMYRNPIDLPDWNEEDTFKINGLCRSFLEEHGSSIELILETFQGILQMYNPSYIVGHNLEYDTNVLFEECNRIQLFPLIIDYINNSRKICTMNYGRHITKIPMKLGSGKVIMKSPKLCELYSHLFPDESQVVDFHQAETDTSITNKCFMKLVEMGKIKV